MNEKDGKCQIDRERKKMKKICERGRGKECYRAFLRENEKGERERTRESERERERDRVRERERERERLNRVAAVDV